MLTDLPLDITRLVFSHLRLRVLLLLRLVCRAYRARISHASINLDLASHTSSLSVAAFERVIGLFPHLHGLAVPFSFASTNALLHQDTPVQLHRLERLQLLLPPWSALEIEMPRLTHLSLVLLGNLTSSLVCSLARFTGLRSLELRFSNPALCLAPDLEGALLSWRSLNLHSLHIGSPPETGRYELAERLANPQLLLSLVPFQLFTSLRSLSLHGRLTMADALKFSALHSLEVLHLSCMPEERTAGGIEAEWAERLPITLQDLRLPRRVHKLGPRPNLTRCVMMALCSMEYLSDIPSLEAVRASDLSELPRFTQLQRLEILQSLSPATPPLAMPRITRLRTLNGLAHLQACAVTFPNLRRLWFRFEYEPPVLEALVRFSLLETLKWECSHQAEMLTGALATLLNGLPRLRTLHASHLWLNCSLTPPPALCVTSLTALKLASVEYSAIEWLTQLTRLESLHILDTAHPHFAPLLARGCDVRFTDLHLTPPSAKLGNIRRLANRLTKKKKDATKTTKKKPEPVSESNTSAPEPITYMPGFPSALMTPSAPDSTVFEPFVLPATTEPSFPPHPPIPRHPHKPAPQPSIGYPYPPLNPHMPWPNFVVDMVADAFAEITLPPAKEYGDEDFPETKGYKRR